MSARVLHVVRSLRPETGGLAEAVRSLARAQRQRGDGVTIVSLDPADLPETVVVGRSSHGYGYSPALVPWLRAHRQEFDVVVVHGLWQYQAFGSWRALCGTDTPYIVYCHGMLDVWFKRAHPLKHLKKWLYWPWADYRVLRDAAAVCFTAEEERIRSGESFWLYRARERIASIGIAAPVGDAEQNRGAFYAAYPAVLARPFLLFLGRIHRKKGVDILLRAYAAALANRTDAPALVVAGPCTDSTYGEELRREAEKLGLNAAVHWLPMLRGEEKWGALHACEAFVLFSHQENFGLAVVEALACGRPVLISDQISIWREIVDDGGGFAAADRVEASAEILTRWQELDEAGREKMRLSARACFERRFEIGQAAAALDTLIDEVKRS